MAGRPNVQDRSGAQRRAAIESLPGAATNLEEDQANAPVKRLSLRDLLEERDRMGDAIQMADLYRNTAMNLDFEGEAAGARALLALAVYRLEQVLGPRHPETQMALNHLALHDFNAADYASALVSYRRLHVWTDDAWGASDSLTRIARIRVWQCVRRLGPAGAQTYRSLGSSRDGAGP